MNPKLTDLERGVYQEIGGNSFLDYVDEDASRLREIAAELKHIIDRTKKKHDDKFVKELDPLKRVG
jgi:hypothetical protein